ncbi:hypothetical protein [Serratia symbiotica]
MQLTRGGELPQAVYVLIDIIDLKQRARELTCKNISGWQYRKN